MDAQDCPPDAAPLTLEIVDGDEECQFLGEGDNFEWKVVGVRVLVAISTGDLFLALAKQSLDIRVVKNLNLGLIDLTSVALDDIPREFASFLATAFNFPIESMETIWVEGENIWPDYPSGLTIAPEQIFEYCYIKYPGLTSYVADQAQNNFKELILAEANTGEILRQNPHPNIAKYWGCEVIEGTIRGLCYGRYAMTLYERGEIGVPLDTQHLLQGVKAGVAHLHSLGLVHNDISSSNIMLDAGDNPVIIDFDSCTREGEKLLKFGTPDWSIEGVKTGSRENDFYGLARLEEHLSHLEERWGWTQEANWSEEELMEDDGEAEDVQY
ncbi:hypothetical protein ACHAQD_001571 [Fusarium lateritium]